MRRTGVALGIALLGLAAGAAAQAPSTVPERVAPAPGVDVATHFAPWTLTSVTPPEIDAETVRNGPCGKPACTEWNIDPVVGFEPLDGGCGTAQVTTRVTITYRLPIWAPATPPSAQMEAWWPRQFASILAHEGGHRDLAVETANAIQELLVALPPEPSCEEMRALAKEEALRLIEAGNRLQREYDVLREAEIRAAIRAGLGPP